MSQTEWEKETESGIWDIMVQTLENLDRRNFTKLKHKLTMKAPAGMTPITWRQVEEAREDELVNIIIRHYTIKHGPQMAVEILEEINERQASVELQDALMTNVKHFIDRNRAALIRRMSDTNIMLVLDELLSEKMLNDVQCNTVQSCTTSHEMMRKLYDYTRSWGHKQKDCFFSFLFKYEHCLIMDLMEQENNSFNPTQ